MNLDPRRLAATLLFAAILAILIAALFHFERFDIEQIGSRF